MSLRDGNKKMSKSEHSDFSRINLSDDPELIFEKIMKSKTDSLLSVYYLIRSNMIQLTDQKYLI
jgi:tryptophanyl-tRNA synthetase